MRATDSNIEMPLTNGTMGSGVPPPPQRAPISNTTGPALVVHSSTCAAPDSMPTARTALTTTVSSSSDASASSALGYTTLLSTRYGNGVLILSDTASTCVAPAYVTVSTLCSRPH